MECGCSGIGMRLTLCMTPEEISCTSVRKLDQRMRCVTVYLQY